MKIKALTIIEIVVALAISTFVIMIAIIVYFVVNDQFSRYKNLNKELQSIYQIHFLLQKDFEDADSISLGKDSVLMIYNSTNLKLYEFHDKVIVIRTPLYTDTFNMESYFEHQNYLPFKQLTVENFNHQIKFGRSKKYWSAMYTIPGSSIWRMRNMNKENDAGVK